MFENLDQDSEIRVKNLGIRFNRENIEDLVIVENFSLDLSKERMICLAGRSGSGKTTILRALAGIDQIATHSTGLDRVVIGSISWWGESVARMTEDQIREARRTRIGFMDQAASMVHGLTALENVLLPLLPDGKSAVAKHRSRAKDLLKMLGLSSRRDYHSERLSGGERQRVVLARALVMSPKVLLLDEPTASLDRQCADDVIGYLGEFVTTGGAVIAASHDPHVSNAADQTIFIENQRVN